MYTSDKQLYVAHSTNGPIHLVGKMCNRHGLIAGATGTGKTVSLQVLAETFSQAGVPCFMADMKGDLSGISQTGTMSSFIQKRCAEFGIENPQFQPCPVRFWDVFGEQGYPMRTTVSAMGPQLLARLLGLNDTQAGVLNIVFRIADDNNLLLIDIKDLRLMLDFCGKNASKLTTEYGMISTASVGAIQRAIMTLESEGAEQFFGEPAFNIQDLIETENGRGIMNVLCADKLMLKPKLYSTFLLWLITELYANLPEVGDQELPKLVFFFDEAHMLFEDTSASTLSHSRLPTSLRISSDSSATASSMPCVPILPRTRRPCAQPPRRSAPIPSSILPMSSWSWERARLSCRSSMPRGPRRWWSVHASSSRSARLVPSPQVSVSTL